MGSRDRDRRPDRRRGSSREVSLKGGVAFGLWAQMTRDSLEGRELVFLFCLGSPLAEPNQTLRDQGGSCYHPCRPGSPGPGAEWRRMEKECYGGRRPVTLMHTLALVLCSNTQS